MRSTIDQKAASIARSAARRAKYRVVTYDVHGYTVDTHDTVSWETAVDYAKELRDSNPLVSLSDIDPIDDFDSAEVL